MLAYSSLIEQAKLRGMPITKMRGILREYLHVLILKYLYRETTGEKIYFTGGTYLRLAHNIKRFSEDLDFNAKNLTKKEFENLLNTIKNELKRVGIGAEIGFSYRDNLFSSDLIFHSIEKEYNIISRYSKGKGIIIKVEINKPKWRMKREAQVISGFGEVYPCICTDKGAFFADKIDAFVKKNRGRHTYDVIFMLSNKYPVDKGVLSALNIKRDAREVILNRLEGLSKYELNRQAEALRPFLFDEKEADLVINAHKIIPILLEKYKL